MKNVAFFACLIGVAGFIGSMQPPQRAAAGTTDTALSIQLDRMERVKGAALTIQDTATAVMSQYGVTVDMGIYQLEKHTDRANDLLRQLDSAIAVVKTERDDKSK